MLVKRDLDGIYFHYRRPDGKWENRCLSDHTQAEIKQKLIEMELPTEGLIRTILHLAERLRDLGDKFDLYCSITDPEEKAASTDTAN